MKKDITKIYPQSMLGAIIPMITLTCSSPLERKREHDQPLNSSKELDKTTNKIQKMMPLLSTLSAKMVSQWTAIDLLQSKKKILNWIC